MDKLWESMNAILILLLEGDRDCAQEPVLPERRAMGTDRTSSADGFSPCQRHDAADDAAVVRPLDAPYIRSRHWDVRTPSSDSARSSQLPCFGV